MAQICGQFAGKIAQVITPDGYLFDEVEYLRHLSFGDGFDESAERSGADQSQRGCDILFRDLIPAEGDYLIECRLRVAQTAGAGASYFTQRGVTYFYFLAGCYFTQPLKYFFGRYLPELELLATRKYGVGNLVELRRRHNEN